MIKMMHPQHGFHMASSLEEADMRKNGWVDDAPAPAAAESAAPAPAAAIAHAAPVVATEPPAGKRNYTRKAKK